jgi:2-polyprenyl-6-hydroxyphenyl methylase/3-demethylubiquinone-9 3-methyltransferase
MDPDIMDYGYPGAAPAWDNDFLLQPITRYLATQKNFDRIFEIGCGNGVTAHVLSSLGYQVTAIDPSESGIRAASEAYQGIRFAVGNAYEALSERYGQFPCVLSLEVIEHCFYPRRVIRTISDLLQDGGTGIISTPYHGYWKNLALAICGRMDAHYTALWDGGHIKFFSVKTMTQLLSEAGFKNIRFSRVGRSIPGLAKSMIVIFEK